MKKLLCIPLLMAAPAFADYVSPTQYKGWSCLEMKYELQYQLELGSKLSGEAFDAGMSLDNAPTAKRAAGYKEALRQSNDVDMSQEALKEAMRRVGCEVKGAKAPVVPEE